MEMVGNTTAFSQTNLQGTLIIMAIHPKDIAIQPRSLSVTVEEMPERLSSTQRPKIKKKIQVKKKSSI